MLSDLFKNPKKLVVVLFVFACIVTGLVVFVMNFSFAVNDEELFYSEYTKLNNVSTEDGKKYPRVSISKNNKIKYATYDEILNIFNSKGNAVIYFGYPKCLYCRSAVQVLIDTAEDTDLDKIYYLDIENKEQKYDELLNILGNEFIDTSDNDRKIYSPLVVFVAEGKVVSYNKGTLFSQKDPYTELDASQIKGLSEIYRYGIRDVLEAMKK